MKAVTPILDLSPQQLEMLRGSADALERVRNNWPLIDPVTLEYILNIKTLTNQGLQTAFTVSFEDAKEFFNEHI